jgi:hypothetical protein
VCGENTNQLLRNASKGVDKNKLGKYSAHLGFPQEKKKRGIFLLTVSCSSQNNPI